MKEKEIDYFTALYNVARVINASLDPALILEEIVRCVVSALNLKAAGFRLLDSRGKKLFLGASCGLSDHYLQKGPVLIEESGLDKSALLGKTIWLKDVQTDKNFQYRDMARKEGIKSVLVLPLSLASKVIGVLRVYSDKVRKFNIQEVRFLEAVANLIAIALDNARMHQKLQIDCDLMAAHKYRIDDN
ncbi:MAG: GAF domain-containing protein [Deltaproteobacteria bacterium]|nr:GAF domain-containing protein [Deltaproteobacteria bacterium]